MKIKTRCGNCGKMYNMASEYVGRTAQCKQCGQHFVMNPYDPPAQPAAPPLGQPPQAFQAPPAPQAPPAYAPPQAQAAPGYAPPQHAMADQTILPNTAFAQNYVQPGQGPQTEQPTFQETPQAYGHGPLGGPYGGPAVTPDPRQRPLHGAGGSALRGAAPQPERGMQNVLCLKCGYSAVMPAPTKRMKVTCQGCGAKIAVGPEGRKKAPRGGGGVSSSSVLLLLFLILLLVGVLFAGPTLLPDVFPDLLGDLLP